MLAAHLLDAESLAAHQIGYQLVLDAIAIAGQVMVGRMLGASDADGAHAAARRMIGWARCSRRRRAGASPACGGHCARSSPSGSPRACGASAGAAGRSWASNLGAPMRRSLMISLAVLAIAAPAAQAQSNPFGPLPQPAPPAPTPVETPVNPADQGSVSRPLLFGIAGGVLLLFIGIGLYITRDARKHLNEHDRREVQRERATADAQRVRGEQIKKKARSKTKAQKQARKKQRR